LKTDESKAYILTRIPKYAYGANLKSYTKATALNTVAFV